MANYVLRWKGAKYPLYYVVDPVNPEQLCGTQDIEMAAKFSCKEEAEALPLALPLSDGSSLWDLYELASC